MLLILSTIFNDVYQLYNPVFLLNCHFNGYMLVDSKIIYKNANHENIFSGRDPNMLIRKKVY